MNALLSYIRHLVTAGLFYILEKTDLPMQGANEAIEFVATALITTLVWAVMKFGGPYLKKVGLIKSIVFLAVTSFAFSQVSCSAIYSAATGQPIPSEPVARVGDPDAELIQVSSADLAQAEAETKLAKERGELPPVYGTYPAAKYAQLIRDTVIESGK